MVIVPYNSKTTPILIGGATAVVLVAAESWAIDLGWITQTWLKAAVLLICLAIGVAVGVAFRRSRG